MVVSNQIIAELGEMPKIVHTSTQSTLRMRKWTDHVGDAEESPFLLWQTLIGMLSHKGQATQ